MSAGLGRVQRAILAALEAEGKNARYLALEILPNQTWVPKRGGKTPLPSAIESIRRALRTLERRGLVEKAERCREGRWALMGRGQALRDDPFGFRSYFQQAVHKPRSAAARSTTAWPWWRVAHFSLNAEIVASL